MKFVILDHLPPEPNCDSVARTLERHFDIMFEVADETTLRTYATECLPSDIGNSVCATALANHRSVYMNYEGPVSNNRGTVQRYAHGTWTGELTESAVLSFDDASKNFAGKTWTVQFREEESQQLKLLRIA